MSSIRPPEERIGAFGGDEVQLAAGQDESAIAPDLVSVDLQLRQEHGNMVHLVEDGAFGEPRQETPRVGLRVMSNIRILEVGVPQVSEHGAAQRCLASVARTRDGDERVLLEEPQQMGRDLPLDHDARPAAAMWATATVALSSRPRSRAAASSPSAMRSAGRPAGPTNAATLTQRL